jgi:hypothetical protein
MFRLERKQTLGGVRLLIVVAATAVASFAQNPTPTPNSSSDSGITATAEIGLRGVHVNGTESKYRSDLNYRTGIRLFDSSILIERKDGDSNFFDTAMITSSGWGGDPNGTFRFNLDRTGFYKFDSNVRRVKYFNFLNNHALGQHSADTAHTFGDTDLTIFPERESIRFRFGYSFNRTDGDGIFTTRAYGDEYPVLSDVRTGSDDLRAGVEGKLWGFNLGLNYGLRRFDERTSYHIDGLNLGNNPTNNPRLFTFEREYPIDGTTHYVHANIQRTFARKLDFTARVIHSQTTTDSHLVERITGREGTANNQVILDFFDITGHTKRPQTRGDIGATWRVTEDFRISDTFTYDQFNISGANTLYNEWIRRTSAGGVIPTQITRSAAHRVTGFRRGSNLLEADYQINRRFGFNIGWRYSQRSIDIAGFDRQFSPSVTSALLDDGHDNSTHALVASFRAKPLDWWMIFGDVEHGESDNYFTRLSNYDFTNYRLRTRASLKKVAVHASFISKSNDNPGRDVETPLANFVAESRSYTFNAGFEWTPITEVSLSSGYTYQHLTARTDIIVPVAGVRQAGISEFYIRDSNFYFDVSATPIRRLSIYASYRINDDRGQGSRIATRAQDLITSYPMRFQSPEIKLAIRISDNIDWNVGYQYYDYKERLNLPAQNYNAHLPFTSLRFYFGRSSDR